ncbi:MAG: peptidyl-tRNA hydrolase, PTH1 family, partial [Microgenomates group bacterium Gr01-1014_80]
VKSEDIIVIHDDLDLMLGKIKVRKGGAAGGHHGVESIIEALGTDQFVRIRLGIGNQKSHSGEHERVHFNAEHFVLEPFMPNERSKVKHMVKQATEALELLLDKGLDVAQSQFN